MAEPSPRVLIDIIQREHEKIASEWMAALEHGGALISGQIKSGDLSDQTRQFVGELKSAMTSGGLSAEGSAWVGVHEFLEGLARSRALQGYTPSETISFVLSLKQPIFAALRRQITHPDALATEIWAATQLIDRLGLLVSEAYQRSREEVIQRQSRELLELSTPVVQLWTRILAVPLIGTLDSERTQIVMERLLESIVEAGAEIAIIDISGVPTVDTLVAQHLIKTVSAARLMGADCIISGIRPQIAQTIVHLGLDLNVVSKANLADAFALALKRTGQNVTLSVSGRRE